MSGVRAGQLIHTADLVLLQRLQTAGPNSINLNPTTIEELGNYLSVATTRDTPDLSFPLESFDCTEALEALLLGADPDGTDDPLLIENYKTLDIASQIKAGRTATDPFAVVASVGVPTLYLESLSYKFGVTDNASQTASFRGDQIYYSKGSTYVEVTAGLGPLGVGAGKSATTDSIADVATARVNGDKIVFSDVGASTTLTVGKVYYVVNKTTDAFKVSATAGGAAITIGTATVSYALTQDVNTAHVALPYNGDTSTGLRYGLAVAVDGQRLLFGKDYIETVTGGGQAKALTISLLTAPATTSEIRVMYQSTVVAEYLQSVHDTTAVRPAAIKGKDIKIYITPLSGGDVADIDIANLISGVQSVSIDWKVTLEKDQEFGNAQLVGQDFGTPTVTCSIDFKPVDADDIYEHIRKVQQTTEGEVVGATKVVVQSLDVVLHHPDTGDALKTLHIPDVTFDVPTYNAQVGQKLTLTMAGQSDTGALRVYHGERS